MGTIDFTDSIYDAQQGNQGAIKFIYDNTIQLFYKEATVFMSSKEAADRAIRDAYIFIFNHLDSLEYPSKFLIWANEVCKNTCIAMLRKEGVFEGTVPPEAVNIGEILPSSEFDPQINEEASMSPSHIQLCLEAVLNSLPDDQRACAILWGEGYTLRNISRKLGISVTAVNYILAYALGNITNSVTTLGANGLPLFSMEPVPFFLWLLLSYYQYYQPEDLTLGLESSFFNILRMLTPGEASVYTGEFYNTDIQEEDGRVKHVTDFTTLEGFSASERGSADKGPASSGVFEDEADISFDNDLPDVSDFIKDDSETPDMDVYSPHPEDKNKADIDILAELMPELKDNKDSDATASEAALAAAAATVTSADDTKEKVNDNSSSENISEGSAAVSDTAAGIAANVAGIVAAENAEGAEGAEGTDAAEDGENAKVSADASADAAVTRAVSSDEQTAEENKDSEEKKKKGNGPIIALIIIIILLCLLAAFFIFFRDTAMNAVNSIFGTDVFHTVQETIPEETTPVETLPEETTPETTTAPETTTVPETTPEETTTEELGPEFTVSIYAGGDALALRSTTGDDAERLLYIPDGTEVLIDTVEGGFGHTIYEGTEGWIWLEYTKVVGNCRIYEPTEMLETPETHTVWNDGTLELKTYPQTFCSTFGQIPDGTEITVEAYYVDAYTGETWAYTSYDGHYGWIYSDYLN